MSDSQSHTHTQLTHINNTSYVSRPATAANACGVEEAASAYRPAYHSVTLRLHFNRAMLCAAPCVHYLHHHRHHHHAGVSRPQHTLEETVIVELDVAGYTTGGA